MANVQRNASATGSAIEARESEPKVSSGNFSVVAFSSNFSYRLYKKRFSGLVGLVILGFVTGLPWAWFGPIAPETANAFGITVNQVNWLGNIITFVYVPVSLLVPVFCSRFGIARCAQIGTLLCLISGWVRYAGTSTALSPQSAYALLMFGQTFSAIAQPIFQILGPIYSEKWFDLNGRTTATMLIAIANPIGSAMGELLAPLVGTPRQSIFILAIVSTAVVPAALLISDSPPTPPTFAGSKPPQSIISLCRAMLGLPVPPDAHMTLRERIDFFIVAMLFGVLCGATNAFSVLSAEWFEPMGYSDTTAGTIGATLLLSGIVASVVTAPLLDRIFTHRLGITLKILGPITALSWLSLIWAVRPNNAAALFVIFAVIGVCSLTMLPIGLELGVELTRNADASAAILWCSGNVFATILIFGEGALRASSTANPPYNMNNALILQASFMVLGVAVFFLRAHQARRELDERMAAENLVSGPTNTPGKSDETTEVPTEMKNFHTDTSV